MTCDICGGEHENWDCPALPELLISMTRDVELKDAYWCKDVAGLLAAAEEIRRLRKLTE